ncbi:MAG: TolC family protein [Gemmatimonadota bacterium]
MRAVLVCAWLAFASTTQAQVVTLTLDQAIETARRFSPAYLQTLNDEGPADVAVAHAYSKLFVPQPSLLGSVTLVAEGEPRFGSVTFGQQPAFRLSNYQVGLDYTFSGRTLLRPGQAQAERKSVEQRVVAAEIALRADVTAGYLEVLRLREQAQQARRERERAQQHLRFAQAREQVGSGTALETKQAEVALGRAEVALLQADNAARVSQLRLAQTVGVEPPDSFALTSTFQVFEPSWERTGLLQMGSDANPTLRSARAGKSAADAGVRIARASYLPTVSLSAAWSGFTREATTVTPLILAEQGSLQSNFDLCRYLRAPQQDTLPPLNCEALSPTPQRLDSIANAVTTLNDQFPFEFQSQPFQFSVGVSLPLSSPLQILRPIPGLGRVAKLLDPDVALSVEQAEAARKDADQQVRALELQLKADITEAYYNLETAHRTVQLQGTNRDRAQEELRLAQERYRLGAGTFLELLDSQTLASQAEVDYINAVYTFHNSIAALEAAVGRRLPRTSSE